MGEIIEEKTNRSVCFEVFHSAQLCEEKGTMEQTQYGVIYMNPVSLGPFNNVIEVT